MAASDPENRRQAPRPAFLTKTCPAPRRITRHYRRTHSLSVPPRCIRSDWQRWLASCRKLRPARSRSSSCASW